MQSNGARTVTSARTRVPEVGDETGTGRPRQGAGVLAPRTSRCHPKWRTPAERSRGRVALHGMGRMCSPSTDDIRWLSPLPEGEGQGEGEGRPRIAAPRVCPLLSPSPRPSPSGRGRIGGPRWSICSRPAPLAGAYRRYASASRVTGCATRRSTPRERQPVTSWSRQPGLPVATTCALVAMTWSIFRSSSWPAISGCVRL